MTIPTRPRAVASPLRRRLARALFSVPALGLAPRAFAVTLAGDPVPHMWHSFNTPDNAFLGRTAASWNNTDPGALYAEWGGFVPDARGSWTFSTPTVGISPQTLAVLNETSGSGIITGSGNIYGLAFGQVPGPPLVFELIVTDQSGASHGGASTRTVVMRSGTKGVLPDLTATLNGVAASWSDEIPTNALLLFHGSRAGGAAAGAGREPADQR